MAHQASQTEASSVDPIITRYILRSQLSLRANLSTESLQLTVSLFFPYFSFLLSRNRDTHFPNPSSLSHARQPPTCSTFTPQTRRDVAVLIYPLDEGAAVLKLARRLGMNAP
jgi:hypothetical protein